MANEMVPAQPRRSLVTKLAERWEVEPTKLLETLKQTVFKTDKGITNEQMMGLLVVANEYRLNPFRKELLAFPDRNGAIVPFITIDGWAAMIARHPLCNGYTITRDLEEGSMTCTLYRKDWAHPVSITEYLNECRRGTGPWGSHPWRMLRHKTLIQCARIALGFGGLLDEDEAERVRDGESIQNATSYAGTQRAQVKRVLRDTAQHLDLPHVDEVTPEPAPEAARDPIEGLPLGELESVLNELRKADSAEAALEVLDRARALPDDQRIEVAQLYEQLYPTGE